MTIIDLFFILVYIIGVLGTYSILREPPNTNSPFEVLWTSVFPAIWPLYWIFIISLLVFKLDKRFLLLLVVLFIASSCTPCRTPRVGLALDPGEYDMVRLVGQTGDDQSIYLIWCDGSIDPRIEVLTNGGGRITSWKKLP